MINYPPRGLIADLITPLGRNNRPDRAALGRLAEMLAARVNGVAAGTVRAGEALSLSVSDRLDVLSAAISATPAGFTLFYEITGRSEDDVLLLLDRAESMLRAVKPAAEVYYLVTPLVYHSNRELPQHMLRLAGLTKRPFVVGNLPDLAGSLRARLRHKNIRSHVLKKMTDNEQVVGLFYDGDLNRALHYQRALKDRRGFRLYDWNEANFMDRPSSSGLVSIGACLAPSFWSDVTESSLNFLDSRRLDPGHLGRIWDSGRAVRGLMKAYERRPAALVKQGLAMMGVIPDPAPAPGRPEAASRQTDALARELESMELLRPSAPL